MATAALALAARGWLPLSPWYPVKVGLLMLSAGALLIRSLSAHQHARFGAANRVTTARAALAALVAGCIGERADGRVAATVVVLAIAVAALDGVDGQLARRGGTASAFGARFDMEVDAGVILALATLAWQWEKAGAWVILSGLLRYLFLAGGAVVAWLRAPLPPSVRRKTICVVQVVGLIAVVAPVVAPPVSTFLAAVGLLALVWSFAVDVCWLWRPAVAAPHGARA